MGIDLIRGGRIASRGARKTKSSNSYLKSLIKVQLLLDSSIHSWAAEPMPNSIKLSISDSISPDFIGSPSPSRELPSISPTTGTQPTKITSSNALSLLLDQSPTMSDSSTSLKDLEFAPSSSPRLLATELLLLRVLATPLTSWLNSHPLAKTSSFWEDPETEKPTDTSVSVLVRRTPTLLPMSELKVVNSREPEAEDDYPILFKFHISTIKTLYTQNQAPRLLEE